jgi:hypothetical protein
MSLFRDVFGPSQEEIWTMFANNIGADYISGNLFKGKKVVAKYENWEVIFDTYTQSTGKSAITYTRIRAPFLSKKGFNFKIYKSGFFSSVGRMFNMQDIEIGYPEFDEKFTIKGSDEVKIVELFSSEKIREILYSQDNGQLEIKDDEGMFGSKIPDDVDILYFQSHGVIKDIERLKSLYMLFILTLSKLKLMDLADEIDSDVKLNLK